MARQQVEDSNKNYGFGISLSAEYRAIIDQAKEYYHQETVSATIRRVLEFWRDNHNKVTAQPVDGQ